MARTPRSKATKILAGIAAVLALLWLLNLPFYSGSKLGAGMSWRMEHGRLTVRRSTSAPSTSSFYIANNSEGMRWSPQFRAGDWGHWSVTLPLWIGFVMCVGGCVWIETRRR